MDLIPGWGTKIPGWGTKIYLSHVIAGKKKGELKKKQPELNKAKCKDLINLGGQ